MKNVTPVKEKEQEKNVPKRHEHDSFSSYPFHLLQRDMNHLFDSFARGLDMWRPRIVEPFLGDFHIKLDLKDNDQDIVLTAEIPGVQQKDIEISLNNETLTIKGEKKEVKEETEKGYYRSERSYGSFQRMIPLPCGIDKDKVQATYDNGVLKVVMPKCKEALEVVKKIEIKSP